MASVLESHTKLFALYQEQINLLSQQITGLNAAYQILLEVLLSVSPQQKQAVGEALAQILARPELLPNEHARQVLASIHQVSTRPSRTSPEGRRGWLQLVSPPDSEQPKS